MIKTLKDTYRSGEAMRTHISTILCGGSVFISGKYLAQKFPLAPLKVAKFKEKHKGLLRHSKAQSMASYTVDFPTGDTFR